MEYSIKARISGRHLHITKELYEQLFDCELTKKNDLSQIGDFASNQTLTIRNGDKKIENVRICGPFRKYTQIEITKTDARKLGVNPPIRHSGDLNNSAKITLETEKASIETDGLIIMARHVHMSPEDAKKYNVKDMQKVKIRIDGIRSAVVDAEVKINDNGVYEVHFDTDEGNAFNLEDNEEVTLKI